MAADSLSVAADTWYRLSVGSLTGGETYKSTILYDTGGTKGATFFGIRNDNNYREHMWQLVPIGAGDSGVFILRTWGAGPSAYLAVGAGTGAQLGDGRDTEPLIKKNTTVTGVEVLWTIQSWGKDAGFRLYTPLNGSNWRLAERDGQSFMTDEEGPTDRQSWTFASTGEKINNVLYSTVRLPQTTFSVTNKPPSPTTWPATGTTATTPSKETVFVTPTPSLPSQPQPSSTNTTPIAIAVTIPICVLALVGLAFFFIRRRRRRQNPNQNLTGLVADPGGPLAVEMGASAGRHGDNNSMAGFKSHQHHNQHQHQHQHQDQRWYELGSPDSEAVELQSTQSHGSVFAELPDTPLVGGGGGETAVSLC